MIKDVLIGSRAGSHHFDFFPRSPLEEDWITSDETKKSTQFLEYHCSKDILGFQWIQENTEGNIASPDVLYTLKCSHLIYDIHWKKTLIDILYFIDKECDIIEELYELLKKDWERKHGLRKVGLYNKSTDTFFKDFVDRTYDHDHIHEIVKHYDEPLYKKILKDNYGVFLSKEKFDKLSHEEKLNLCREEIYVIAIERFLILQFIFEHRVAYKQSLKIILTRLASGWFPDFIVRNLKELHSPQYNYWKKFKENVSHE